MAKRTKGVYGGAHPVYNVTPQDRAAVADFFLMGSHHESVMHVRNAIMAGEQDDMPMFQFAVFYRELLEKT